MYTLLLLVAPLILLLLSIGEWYWVLHPSWLWWLAYQFYPEEAAVPWYIRHGENFPIAAWQVLFVTGHVLGFYRDALTAWLQRFRRLRVVSVALGVAVTLALISLAWGAEASVRLLRHRPERARRDVLQGAAAARRVWSRSCPWRSWPTPWPRTCGCRSAACSAG